MRTRTVGDGDGECVRGSPGGEREQQAIRRALDLRSLRRQRRRDGAADPIAEDAPRERPVTELAERQHELFGERAVPAAQRARPLVGRLQGIAGDDAHRQRVRVVERGRAAALGLQRGQQRERGLVREGAGSGLGHQVRVARHRARVAAVEDRRHVLGLGGQPPLQAAQLLGQQAAEVALAAGGHVEGDQVAEVRALASTLELLPAVEGRAAAMTRVVDDHRIGRPARRLVDESLVGGDDPGSGGVVVDPHLGLGSRGPRASRPSAPRRRSRRSARRSGSRSAALAWPCPVLPSG